MNRSPASPAGPPASAADLVVDSATGVDVALPIAGPGARAFAFIIDWMIRTALAAAWYIAGAFLYHGGETLAPPLTSDAAWFIGVVIPSAAIYFLYHFVLEVVMHGRTPGKRLAGIRIVTRDGGTPGIGALLTRNVFRLIDSFPLMYGVGLLSTMLTRDRVRIGDLAAGTLLVYERAQTPALEDLTVAVRETRLDAAHAEIASELLRRWHTLEPASRARIAQAILVRASPAQSGDAQADSPETDDALRARLERLVRAGSP